MTYDSILNGVRELGDVAYEFGRESQEAAHSLTVLGEILRPFYLELRAYQARLKEIRNLKIKELTLGLTYREKIRLYAK